MLARLKGAGWLLAFIVGVLLSIFPPAPGEAAARPPQAAHLGVVVLAVSDGDTFSIQLSGLDDKVRLLGIDAPEKAQPRWGLEAKKRLETLVLGKTVQLVLDAHKPRDAYGRLLAYVYVGSVFVQRELLEHGLVVAQSYGKPPAGFYLLEGYQKQAKDKRLGVWSDTAFVIPDTWRKTHGVGR